MRLFRLASLALVALLIASAAAIAGGLPDSNGNLVYGPPSIMYGPPGGNYGSNPVPHVICDSGCSGGAGSTTLKSTAAAPTYIEGSSNPFSSDLSGNLRVTLPTPIPAGANIIGKFGIDQTTPGTTNGVVVNNASLAITAASLPLPTNAAQETGGNLATLAGAVTSSVLQSNTKQVNGVTVLTGTGAVGTGAQRIAVGTDTATIAGSAPGTAGSPSTNVVSVQGVASGTVIPENQTQVNGVAVSTGAGATGTGSQRVTAAQDTTTIAGSAPGTAGTPSTNVVSVQGVASGTVIPENQTQVNGVAILTGTGAVGTGAQRIAVGTDTATIAGSAPGTAGTPSTNVVSVQGVASGTVLPTNQSQIAGTAVSVNNGATDAGTMRVTLSNDSTGVVKLAAGTASVGSFIPQTSNNSFGSTLFTLVAANSNNSTNIKASAGQVYHIEAYGISTSTPAWLKFYNKATAPTCGTDTPVWQILIPAPSAGGGGAVSDVTAGLVFATGIGICVVTGIANNDNTSVAAATYVVNVGYK